MIVAHAVYNNGKFYDKESKEPIVFTENMEYLIYAPEEEKMKTKKSRGHSSILSESEKKQQVETTPDVVYSKKIRNANTPLYFTIRHNGIEYQFECIILEDLYLFKKQSWKQNMEKLYPCMCELVRLIRGNKKLAEPIRATSLNELYKLSYVYFFGNDGNPACNAIARFYYDKDNSLSTLDRLRVSKGEGQPK